MERPTLSIIIPTHNSEPTIKRCLSSLTSQSYPRDKFEIIIVDDGSKDNTLDLCKKGEADQIIQTEPCFQGKARNIGAKNSIANNLAFLDSDCEVEDGWIESIIKELEEKEAITGPIHNGNPQSTVAWAEYFLEFGGWSKKKNGTKIRFIPGCNQAYQKKSFEKTGGFTELRASEDILFGESLRRAGIDAFFVDGMQIFHLCRTSPDKFYANMNLLGRYSARARKSIPSLKYGSLMTNRWMIPILFVGKLAKIAEHAIGQNSGKFFLALPSIIIGTASFCKGVLEEIKQN